MDAQMLKKLSENFVLMFKNVNVGQIILVLIIGWLALSFFLVLCIFLWIIKLIHVPVQSIDDIILHSNHHHFVKCVLLMFPPNYIILTLKFTIIPFLHMLFWVLLFLYNCWIFVVSLGKSSWIKFNFS